MKKNIVFYYHNFGGLGHGNRISLIIQNIINDFGSDYNIIVLNSGEKQDFLFTESKNLKIINLSNYEISNYEIINNEYNNKIKNYRKAIFNKLFSITSIESIIIEHFPFGRNFLNQEIRFLIDNFKKNNDKGNVFSSVRDIFDINSINKDNLGLFDRFLIHSDEKITNYEQYFDKNINRKIIYTGYVVNNSNLDEKYDEENHIIISVGGGQDGLNGILDFIEKLNKSIFDGKIYISLGKLFNEENISKIKNILLTKFEVEIVIFFDNFIELKKHAKLVISMGGYNNFIENVYYGKKSIIYPRLSDNEQKKRLDLFSKKSDFILDGNNINTNNINDLLLVNYDNNLDLNFNGAYFSSSFIVNYKKYKYLKVRLTNACNATCDMCGVIKRERKYNDLIKIKRSILDFYKLGGEVINFTGGEPTIYKGFWEVLKFSKDLGLITSVSTNGSTLGKDFFINLYNQKIRLIDYIDISIDGLYKLQDIRRNYIGLFDKISNNLKKLLEAEVFTHINITIRNDNILEMKDIFDYFSNKGINSISFGMITSSPVNDTSKFIPSYENIKSFYTITKKYIIDSNKDMKVIFSPDNSGLNIDDFIKSILDNNSFDRENGKKCSFISSKKELRINEGGNISACCETDNYDEGIGNINNDSLLNIVLSKNYENFLNRTFPNISKACLNCKILN